MENLDGKFKVDLLGAERELVCNFGVVEKLERHILKKPIFSALDDAVRGNIYVSDVVDVIMVGLEANGDTRFKRNEVGQEVQTKGALNYMSFYVDYLTYAVTGKQEIETQAVSDSDKKK